MTQRKMGILFTTAELINGFDATKEGVNMRKFLLYFGIWAFCIIFWTILIVLLFHKSDGDVRYKQGYMDGIQSRIDYEHGK